MRAKLKGASRGQAVTEFALIAIVLVMLLIGAAQLATIYYALVSVDTAAREGARVASEQPGNTTLFSSPNSPGSPGSHTCTTGAGQPNACKAVFNSTRKSLGGIINANNMDATLTGSTYPSVTATTCPQTGTGTSDGLVTVAVSYDAPIFLPIIGPMLSTNGTNHHTVKASVQIRVEPCINTNGS
jgi:Flp pilus assembly protein TadG